MQVPGFGPAHREPSSLLSPESNPVLPLAYWLVLTPIALVLVGVGGFLFYIWWRYCSIIVRIFEETPVFAPLRTAPDDSAEDVRFNTPDGLTLIGSYLRRHTQGRAGVIVFSHEYLGDRWSACAYLDGLREVGFDIFTFDFRNHGDSQVDPSYNPLQWVSDLEITDLRAALDYLRSRPDADPAGVALFGVSRGGGTSLVQAALEPSVWAVATDGAFPTRGTMLAYVIRWASIPIRNQFMLKFMPRGVYVFAAWIGRVSSEWRRGRRYPNLERAMPRIAPRPWLLIHGERDVYISPEIARDLYSHAGDGKQAWFVPKAKHNRAREMSPERYAQRLIDFFTHSAPRRLDRMESSPIQEVLDTGSRCEPIGADHSKAGVAVG
jgi:fermentation-respiration switch protein FrsA (DUF1100 family)